MDGYKVRSAHRKICRMSAKITSPVRNLPEENVPDEAAAVEERGGGGGPPLLVAHQVEAGHEYSTVQYSTVQCSTVQYSAVQ